MPGKSLKASRTVQWGSVALFRCENATRRSISRLRSSLSVVEQRCTSWGRGVGCVRRQGRGPQPAHCPMLQHATHLLVIGAKVLPAHNLLENAQEAQRQVFEALGQLEHAAKRLDGSRARCETKRARGGRRPRAAEKKRGRKKTRRVSWNHAPWHHTRAPPARRRLRGASTYTRRCAWP